MKKDEKKTRKIDPYDVLKIVVETVDESMKDLNNLEERRPMIHWIGSAVLQLFQQYKGGGKSRDIYVSGLVAQIQEKLDESCQV